MEETEELSVRCAWCDRYREGDAWERRPRPAGIVTHGICPDCFAELMSRPVPARLLFALEAGP